MSPRFRDWFRFRWLLVWRCLITKNAIPDKYSCSGYGIEFNTRGYHSLSDDGIGKSVIIFGINLSSSVHIDNKRKDILVLGKGPTQG